MLASSEAGISHRLSIRRGVLKGSLRRPRERFFCCVCLEYSVVVPRRKRMDVLPIRKGHRLLVGDAQEAIRIPVVVRMVVNIFILLIPGLLLLIHILGLWLVLLKIWL